MGPLRTEIGEPWWDARPVWIIGGGASARALPLDKLFEENVTVVAVNDSAMGLPWCSALISVDRHWMTRRVRFIRDFTGEVILGVTRGSEDVYPPAEMMGGTQVEISTRGAFSTILGRINTGGNGGHAAINVAMTKQARTVFLVGFDMKVAADGADHWHGGYAWAGSMNHAYYPAWAKGLDALAAEIAAATAAKVFNLNPDSAIRGFPFLSFEEALQWRS